MPMPPHITDTTILPYGYVLQNYRIEDLLGRGGFGITYRAIDLNLEKTVAIKEYFPKDIAFRHIDHTVQLIAESCNKDYYNGLKRFIHEARTISRFEHVNFARVYSFFEMNNTGYMVMKYEKGHSLKEIRKNRQFTEKELNDIILQILDALERLHNENFIHRDIKPENIILREDGTPVLIDFGSARPAHGQTERNLTCLVSPGYAPIEQYTGDHKRDKQGPWTDIYSLSATIYYAVSGISPSTAIDRGDSILQTGGDTYIPIELIAKKQYSRQFLKAIDYGMTFKHKERPQSISDWRAMFETRQAYRGVSGGKEKEIGGFDLRKAILVHGDKSGYAKDSNLLSSWMSGKKVYVAVFISLIIMLVLLFYADIGSMPGSENKEVLLNNGMISRAHQLIIQKGALLKQNFENIVDSITQNDLESDNFKTAVNTLKPLAESGHAFAQYDLGIIYFIRDANESLKWFSMAANQGYAKAQKQLGFIYDNGINVKEDNEKAFHWYKLAAEQGNAEAQFMLGTMYLNGEGVGKDVTEAEKWLSRAGQKGYENARESIQQFNKQLELINKS